MLSGGRRWVAPPRRVSGRGSASCLGVTHDNRYYHQWIPAVGVSRIDASRGTLRAGRHSPQQVDTCLRCVKL